MWCGTESSQKTQPAGRGVARAQARGEYKRSAMLARNGAIILLDPGKKRSTEVNQSTQPAG
jgi:hypothetical protein